jgi:hypothetical protein
MHEVEAISSQLMNLSEFEMMAKLMMVDPICFSIDW